MPVRLVSAAAICIALASCGGSSKSSGTTTLSPEPSQLYFSPQMGNDSLATYAIDHTASPSTFVRATYSVSGEFVTDSGTLSLLSDGIYGLNVTYLANSNNSVTLNPPLSSGFAVELPAQAALVGITTPAEAGIPEESFFSPVVPTSTCPDISTAETFQFVTIPKPLASVNSTGITTGKWNPALETAYGSVQIATSGTAVQFSSISQYTLPAANGGTPGAPQVPGPSSAASICAQTYFGQVIAVPVNSTVTDPGSPNQSNSPTATIGIGPSGFLVEDAGQVQSGTQSANGTPYENILGAGYGAVGLPQPGSDVTSSVVGAQYTGFLNSPSNFALISSFGLTQSSCSALAAQIAAAKLSLSANTIYGGEFTVNSGASNPLGSTNCDIAVDLGSVSSNGLYTGVTVYVGAAFSQNATGQLYTFPGVAIAGQLQGQDAIFLVGADTTSSPVRSWGIYLLQQNSQAN